jgi:hypothetical protein
MTDAGEIIKSGAFDKLADIIHKLAGPMAEEVGQMMGDRMKLYALKNWIDVVKRGQQILADAHLPTNAVPPRLFLPILQAASIEDDETLQGLWAGLLASASEESDSLSPSFIETLKQLTPAEAKALNDFFESVPTQDRISFDDAATSLVLRGFKGKPQLVAICDTFERLGFFRRQYDVRQIQPQRYEMQSNEVVWKYEFTKYGLQFMKACKGPARK